MTLVKLFEEAILEIELIEIIDESGI